MDTPYELQSGLGLAIGFGLIQLLIQLRHKTARQHPRYVSLINRLLHFPPKCMHFYTEVLAPSHRGALHPPTGVPFLARAGAWVLPRARDSAWDLPMNVAETDFTR
ncbi:hypothetical protein Acr_10g0009490 [Actinidia rufa]|uniref:Uncharacterized protein n=1 Tax=Actinidia rufa TaxID=165716 RepID=A0A7J0FA38_9ERIC|nr:hypothetical protein Acr_10g0009490 [Actinidia rufa]